MCFMDCSRQCLQHEGRDRHDQVDKSNHVNSTFHFRCKWIKYDARFNFIAFAGVSAKITLKVYHAID